MSLIQHLDDTTPGEMRLISLCIAHSTPLVPVRWCWHHVDDHVVLAGERIMVVGAIMPARREEMARA